jgi:hypothetical protein
MGDYLLVGFCFKEAGMALKTMQEMELEKDSYNPQFDFLLQYRNGQTLSSVYGRIWRYCQMKRGQCEVSIQRIADEINVSYNTAQAAIKWLCNNGLVIDLTPDAGRHIHAYTFNQDEHERQSYQHNLFRKEPKPEIAFS